MLRYILGGLIVVGVVGAMRAPATPADFPPVATATNEPSPMPIVAYRPGEPMMTPGAVELKRGGDSHFTASVSVNGQPVTMLVDTGASVVALTVDDARRLGIAVDPATFGVVGTGASGPVKGMTTTLADVAVGDRHVAGVGAVVLEGLDRSLLGQSYLKRLEQVRIDGDTMMLR